MTKIRRKSVDHFYMSDDLRNCATVTVDTETGHVVVNCDSRNISGSYTWANWQTGCNGIYEFLDKNGHDWHYFMLKFVPALFNVFSPEGSRRSYRREVLDARRSGELDKDDARAIWREIGQCELAHEFASLADFREPAFNLAYKMSEDVKWFADTFWLPFVHYIRREHKEFQEKIADST